MKKGFLTIFFMISYVLAYTQSLQVLDTRESYDIKIGDQVRTLIKLKNVSDRTLHILVRRDETQIGSSQKTYFCWAGDCTEPDGNQMFVSQIIKPGEILETFLSVLDAGLDETVASLKYTFYDRDNPTDYIEVRLSYTIKDQVNQGLMYNSNRIRVSDIYPNPVSEMVYLDYTIFDEVTTAKIVFHNVLGSVVGKFELNPIERIMKINTIDFKPGVYFYTLYVENEGKVTKKLVIKR